MVSGARGLDAFTTDKNQFPLMPEFTGICRICMEVGFSKNDTHGIKSNQTTQVLYAIQFYDLFIYFVPVRFKGFNCIWC